MTDTSAQITAWNPFATELYGWAAEEAIGHPLADLLAAPAVVEIAREIVAEILGGSTWAGPFTLRRKDDGEIEIFAIVTPLVEHGEITGLLSTSTAVDDNANDMRLFDLTDREREVLKLSITTRNNGEIAADLGISRRTVESHQASIYQKLGVTSRLELIVFAIQHGIVKISELGRGGTP